MRLVEEKSSTRRDRSLTPPPTLANLKLCRVRRLRGRGGASRVSRRLPALAAARHRAQHRSHVLGRGGVRVGSAEAAQGVPCEGPRAMAPDAAVGGVSADGAAAGAGSFTALLASMRAMGMPGTVLPCSYSSTVMYVDAHQGEGVADRTIPGWHPSQLADHSRVLLSPADVADPKVLVRLRMCKVYGVPQSCRARSGGWAGERTNFFPWLARRGPGTWHGLPW